jgi:putative hydrolase of the HAD superfamily
VTAPTALILDFGGVLTSDLWESVRGCARREGLPETAILDVLHLDPAGRRLFAELERGEVSQADFEQHLAAAAGIAPEGLLARMCADLRPDDRMLYAVGQLRRLGVATAVLSNSWGSGYFSPYVGYDLENRVDVIVLSDQVGLRKPEPEIFALTADKLGVPASACVFVDDVAANLPGAQALGIRTIHHVETGETVGRLAELFDVGVEALSRQA